MPEARGQSPGLLRFNLGFVDEHHRNIVLDRVDAVALAALQALAVRRDLDGGLVQRANENIKQFLANSHVHSPLVALA